MNLPITSQDVKTALTNAPEWFWEGIAMKLSCASLEWNIKIENETQIRKLIWWLTSITPLK